MLPRSWLAFVVLFAVAMLTRFGLAREPIDPYAFAAMTAAALVLGCAPRKDGDRAGGGSR